MMAISSIRMGDVFATTCGWWLKVTGHDIGKHLNRVTYEVVRGPADLIGKGGCVPTSEFAARVINRLAPELGGL